ncbi:hypothetical protein LJR186_001240 [Microbacterium foliorum]
MASKYLKRGVIRVATDTSMAVVLSNPASQFYQALIDLLADVAAGVIANDPTVVAAAGAAVDAKLAAEDVLLGAQNRSPREGRPDAFRMRDRRGMVFGEWRPDGTLWAARIESPTIVSPSIGSGGAAVSRVYLVAILGQSNAVGKGEPSSPMLDGASSRIWQLPEGGNALTPAVVPLTVPGGTATGLAPAHALARRLVQNDPNCAVVLVPMPKGGSGLVIDPAMGYGKWAVGYSGPNPQLYSNAVGRMGVAAPLITSQFGITPFVITHWAQGEADGADGITRSAYVAEFDPLVTDWLGRFGGIFLITGMVPQALGTGTRTQIQLGLQDTPRRLEKVAYVTPPDNGGGAAGPADVIHFSLEAVEKLGDGLFKALRRAVNNVAASHTYPPLKVEATKWGNEVTVEWTPPYCRVTAYELQSSPDGSTWTTVTMAEPLATRAAFTSAVPVKVRVRAIGTETSNWTAPVPAIGG